MNTLLEENYLSYPSAVKEAMGILVDYVNTNITPSSTRPKDNEIWYTGEFYDLQALIDWLVGSSSQQMTLKYNGPAIKNNEFDGEKWIITFDTSVTTVGMTQTGNYISLYPMIANQPQIGIICNVTSIILPSSITTIKTGFALDTNITEITIPENVQEIERMAIAFSSQTASNTAVASSDGQSPVYASLKVICKPAVPPTLHDSAFAGYDCEFYVPADSVEVYKSAEKWSAYADKIQAIQ